MSASEWCERGKVLFGKERLSASSYHSLPWVCSSLWLACEILFGLNTCSAMRAMSLFNEEVNGACELIEHERQEECGGVSRSKERMWVSTCWKGGSLCVSTPFKYLIRLSVLPTWRSFTSFHHQFPTEVLCHHTAVWLYNGVLVVKNGDGFHFSLETWFILFYSHHHCKNRYVVNIGVLFWRNINSMLPELLTMNSYAIWAQPPLRIVHQYNENISAITSCLYRKWPVILAVIRSNGIKCVE